MGTVTGRAGRAEAGKHEMCVCVVCAAGGGSGGQAELASGTALLDGGTARRGAGQLAGRLGA